MKKAILLSGGIDSTALAYLYRNQLSLAITVNYGQKSAEAEIRVSKIICKQLNLKHQIVSIDCSSLGSGEMAKNRHKMSIVDISEGWCQLFRSNRATLKDRTII
jgi:7-cyano-7-deazaguanine synthase